MSLHIICKLIMVGLFWCLPPVWHLCPKLISSLFWFLQPVRPLCPSLNIRLTMRRPLIKIYFLVYILYLINEVDTNILKVVFGLKNHLTAKYAGFSRLKLIKRGDQKCCLSKLISVNETLLTAAILVISVWNRPAKIPRMVKP